MKILTKKLLIGIAVLILIAGGLAYYLFPLNASTTAEEVKEVKVRRGNLQIAMEADGKTDLSVRKLKFPINGVLDDIFAELGGTLQKGDVIARLDGKNSAYEVTSAQANYEAALAKLEDARLRNQDNILSEHSKLNSARLQWEKEQLDYEDMLQNAEKHSQTELAQKELSLDNLAANYELAQKLYESALQSSTKVEEAAIAQAKAALDKAKRNLEELTLKSPVKGKVVLLNYKLGETVSSNNDFAIISDEGGLQVNAQVLELDVKDVFIGQNVEIEFEAMPSQSFLGTVTYVDSLPVNDPNGVVAYNVNIKLDLTDEAIKSGSTCLITFIIEQKKDVLIIPNEAVMISDGKQAVEVKDNIGNFSVRNIKTGFTDGKNSEVVEGLQEGETVLIRKAINGNDSV